MTVVLRRGHGPLSAGTRLRILDAGSILGKMPMYTVCPEAGNREHLKVTVEEHDLVQLRPRVR